jgi:hypothetical protein
MSEQSSVPYNAAFDDLRNVYLEDSWVLAVDAPVAGTVTFELEVVLTPEHPQYHPPTPGEQHCYVRGRLTVSGVTTVEQSDAPPAVDASGTLDHGNIHAFVQTGQHRWEIEGTWGSVSAESPTVSLAFSRP